MTTTKSDLDAAPAWATRKAGGGDAVFKGTAFASACVILLALAGVFVFLSLKGAQGFTQPTEVYQRGYGDSFIGYVLPLLGGTVIAAVIALIIAVPLAIGIALVITQYAPPWLASPVAYVIDLLAAVPSVIYGLWGGLFLAPKLVPVYQWFHDTLGFIPLFGKVATSGRSISTAGVVLAIMILPIITAISREVFARTPRLHREAALALGATRWETIRMTVFPYGRSGVVSAVMLGLGRALGETLAVVMVLSPGTIFTIDLFSGSNTPSIAANVALKYSERSPGTLEVLIATGLVLFVMTFVVNFAARYIVARQERKFAV
ncbi:phosphate ABC transporter permease subunit PstC [Nocardioides rubriscoriae]|uniref:phosphate ABC transporter permease subunit PstC n=1 Tax=Nocardioides rubriscoriae TaxID=642762 RepID=UPI0011DF03CD|nr:phosphate ABC transporter permease subunit PstC [Nocardioides rubriscoriae]